MGEHAKFSPSAAKRWKTCPASVRESESIASPDTESSLKGTACHWAMAEWLTNGEPPPVGTKAPNGIDLTQELLEMAGEAVGWVRGYVARAGGPCTVLVEERVQIGATYYGLPPELLFGTADVIILGPQELVVLDLKSGWRNVEAEENPQLTLYSVGVCCEIGWLWPVVRFVIIQPKQGGPKEWLITMEELREKADEFREPIANALSDSPRYVPTDCTENFCPAVATCTELHKQAIVLAQREFAEPAEMVKRITVEQMVHLLDNADLIRGVLSAVEVHALNLIQLGTPVPGYKVVEGKKNRIWKPGNEEEIVALVGKDRAYTPPKLISPAQAEKLVKGLDPFIEKPKGEPRLAKESDKRPALGPHFDAVEVGDPLD
jgi:hypothetical protein